MSLWWQRSSVLRDGGEHLDYINSDDSGISEIISYCQMERAWTIYLTTSHMVREDYMMKSEIEYSLFERCS